MPLVGSGNSPLPCLDRVWLTTPTPSTDGTRSVTLWTSQGLGHCAMVLAGLLADPQPLAGGPAFLWKLSPAPAGLLFGRTVAGPPSRAVCNQPCGSVLRWRACR